MMFTKQRLGLLLLLSFITLIPISVASAHCIPLDILGGHARHCLNGGGGGESTIVTHSFSVTNGTNRTMYVAYNYKTNPQRVPPGNSKLAFYTSPEELWISSGWHKIEPGETKTLVNGIENAYVYYYATAGNATWQAGDDDDGAWMRIHPFAKFTGSDNSILEQCENRRNLSGDYWNCDVSDLTMVRGRQIDLRVRPTIRLTL